MVVHVPAGPSRRHTAEPNVRRRDPSSVGECAARRVCCGPRRDRRLCFRTRGLRCPTHLAAREPKASSQLLGGVRLRLVARCENGDGDETRSSPCDRVGSENPDLIGARTEGSHVIDGGLQRGARIPRRDGATTIVNLEFAIRACPRNTCHAFDLPLRRAAKRSKRSSSSRGSDSLPQPRSSSRIPGDIDSRLTSRPGRGAPCFPAGKAPPR